ncbi:MAG: CapA family protein [Actinobacteria bacterium]|nr:CapA family protein [Actinomycetota bacterium]
MSPARRRARLGWAGLVLALAASCSSGAGGASGSTSTTASAGPRAERPSSTTTSTTTSTTSTTSTTTTTLPPGPTRITLAFAGDLLPHGPVNDRAAANGRATGVPFDYAPMLAPMAPIVGSADVAICHLEVPVHPPGEAITTYPSFGAPPELVDGAKAAGYDGCSNASNHSLDRGRAGIAATLDRFDQLGLHHAGTARTAEEGATTTVYDVDGIRIAHLSYAYGFNGYRIPADAPWAVNQIDPARIRADAARARAEGADLVVVSLHWGTEYVHEPSAYQRQVASEVLPSPDIDLVVGHHAHVVQPIGQVGGTYVVWGMGNQLANQRQVPRSDGLTVVATAELGWDLRWHVTGIEAVPTWVEAGSFRVLPVVRTLADPATSGALRAELSASYDRTAAVLAREPTAGVTLAPKP